MNTDKQTTTDEARAALLAHRIGPNRFCMCGDFYADGDQRRYAQHLAEVVTTGAVAAIRAGLDVERLAEAIKATYTGGAYLNWSYYRQAAKSIAAEYARLAKDAER